jgi:hypothetical protein
MTATLRLAAARLVMLHKDDRAWLLAQLPAADAARLRRVMASPDLARVSMHGPVLDTRRLKAETPKSMDRPWVALDGMDAEWTALVLSTMDAPSQENYLASAPEKQASDVGHVLARLPSVLPPRLRAAVGAWHESKGGKAP